MKTNIYVEIKNKVLELNRINDKVRLLNWNKEDGPKFKSIKEMKNFEKCVLNGNLDYLIDNDPNFIHDTRNDIINIFTHSINDYTFYIYTYKTKNNYVIHMSIQNKKTNNIINNIYTYKTSNLKKADSYLKKLKTNITTNTLEYILNNIKIEIDTNINKLTTQYDKLTYKS